MDSEEMSGFTAVNNITSADKGDDEFVFTLLTDNYYPYSDVKKRKKWPTHVR